MSRRPVNSRPLDPFKKINMGREKKKRKKKLAQRVKILQLMPRQEYQERETSMNDIKLLIDQSTSPSFVQEAKRLQDSFISGDELSEFCTSKESWEQGMGSAGFVLKRNGEIIKSLVCKMN
ncbi:MAG: hypothetical protein WCA35_23510 [Kovacikia sp.]